MTDQSLSHLYLAVQEAQARMERMRRSGILHTLETTLAQHAQHMANLEALNAMKVANAEVARYSALVARQTDFLHRSGALDVLHDTWKHVHVQALTSTARFPMALVPTRTGIVRVPRDSAHPSPTVTEMATLPADRSVTLPEPTTVVIGTIPQEQAQSPTPRELDAHRAPLSIVPRADVVDAGTETHVAYAAAYVAAYAAAHWTKPCGNLECDNLIPDRRRYCAQCRDEARKTTQNKSSYLRYLGKNPTSRANWDARARGFRNVRDRMAREGRAHSRRA